MQQVREQETALCALREQLAACDAERAAERERRQLVVGRHSSDEDENNRTTSHLDRRAETCFRWSMCGRAFFTSLVAAAFGFAACGARQSQNTVIPATISHLTPLGRVWWCSGVKTGSCWRQRSQCESLEGGCMSQKNAACFSFQLILDEDPATLCFRSFANCGQFRESVKTNNREDLRTITDCAFTGEAEWPTTPRWYCWSEGACGRTRGECEEFRETLHAERKCEPRDNVVYLSVEHEEDFKWWAFEAQTTCDRFSRTLEAKPGLKFRTLCVPILASDGKPGHGTD